jgi:membrane protease YdiL (CAAX protease family)
MKCCSYCGREYPDDAVKCAVDHYALPNVGDCSSSTGQADPPGQKMHSNRVVEVAAGASESDYAAYPDYQWSARDAWKCLGMFLLIGTVFAVSVFLFDMHSAAFRLWRWSGLGLFAQDLVRDSVLLFTAIYFARTETLSSFWRGFGLDQKPSEHVWFGIVIALVIRGFGHVMVANGWSPGVSNHELVAFEKTVGVERFLFLVPPLLLGPLFEETILRGFLYRAFRNSYPWWLSIALIIAWTANTHWSQYSTSWVAAFDLSVLTVVQCYLREKSNGIWDCIVCHMVFNASVLFV